jgi:hypothetical protein
MACRSILLRILEVARKERLIATNPVRKVEAPKPRLDPNRSSGHQRDEPSPPRRSATSWLAAGRSPATTS